MDSGFIFALRIVALGLFIASVWVPRLVGGGLACWMFTLLLFSGD